MVRVQYNWAGNHTYAAARVVEPASVAELDAAGDSDQYVDEELTLLAD